VVTKGGDLMKAKISQIGNSIGIILPKEAVTRLKIRKGDTVYLVETPDGYSVTPYDPEFEDQMAVARQGMVEYRNTLRELAK
jgi:putative addiction module antidote